MMQTAVRLCRTRPDVMFIQCPSVLLGLWAGVLKLALGYTLVADLHNEAVEPFNYSFSGYARILQWIRRLADVSLVTNEPLKTVVERRGGTAFVLPDKVPDLDADAPRAAGVAPYAVFVCSYAPDEPHLDVFEAAALLGPAVTVYVTGKPPRFPAGVCVPPNLRLTGFLAEDAYEDLLRGADVIIDLTRMDNCLVCGAYEAVAVERPLVTSDTRALRGYFTRGTVYTAHDPRSLASAITAAIEQKVRLAAEMKLLKVELREEWARQGDDLRRLLGLE